jgi:nucleoside-diphosphate-sugar epimerase
MRVLVTGSRGMVGRAATDCLRDRGDAQPCSEPLPTGRSEVMIL